MARFRKAHPAAGLLLVFSLTAASQIAAAATQFAVRQNPSADNNSLTVAVRIGQNQPAMNARVEVRSLGTREVLASGYTNARGVAELNGVPNGTYDVVAVLRLNEASERVDVRGIDASVTLNLPGEGDAGAGNNATVSVSQFKAPGKARGALRKAQNAADKRKLDDARKYVEQALAVYPEYSEALTLRGVLKLDAHDHDGAIADLQKAIECDASFPTAYFVMGAAMNQLSRYDDAVRSLERGIALSPMSWQGYFEMAKAQIGKAQYQAAIRSLDKAQGTIRSEFPLIHLVRAHAMLSLKNYPNAMLELQAYLEKAPTGAQSEAARQTLDQVRAFAAKKP